MSISVIIPVGPNHRQHLPLALKSVQAQTYQPIETIVVDDSGEEPKLADSWYTIIATSGRTGASHARNLGLKMARGQWVVFLDADDTLLARALEHLITAAQAGDASYYYGDWWNVWGDQQRYYQAPEYEQTRFLRHNLHVVTALYPTQIAKRLGGFDESMQGYEDWEFNVRLAVYGYCGKRVPKPILAYRIDQGYRREWSRRNEKELIAFVHTRYQAFVNGRKMAMCCGAKSSHSGNATFPMHVGGQTIMNSEDAVRMEYIGPNDGFIPYRNAFGGSGRVYRGGSGSYRYIDADPRDVEFLLNTGVWRLVDMGDQTEKPLTFGADEDVVLPTVPDKPEPVTEVVTSLRTEDADEEKPAKKSSSKKA